MIKLKELSRNTCLSVIVINKNTLKMHTSSATKLRNINQTFTETVLMLWEEQNIKKMFII